MSGQQRACDSFFTVTSGLKSGCGFHENTMNVSRNFANHTSLEYFFFYDIGEYFELFICKTCFFLVNCHRMVLEKIPATMFLGEI